VISRVLFVLGKGGVGRSTVSTALGLHFSGRGERVLILEWTVAEAIAPWFGLPSAGVDPVLVAPRLSVANYRLDEALRAYFVDHLKLDFFFRHVVNGTHLRRLIEAAPGMAELLFLGQLWWLTTLAEQEAGLSFDRIVVDAPATGHGVSLLDLPATLTSMGAAGLLGGEIERVVKMMHDPAWTSAIVVALPEELAMEETLELVPHVTVATGRPPIAAFVNRSVVPPFSRSSAQANRGEGPTWLARLGARLTPPARDGLATVHAELRNRAECEGRLRAALEGKTALGTFPLGEQLLTGGPSSPRDVAVALSPALGAHLEVP
jgi:hypothetical protein